MEIRRKIKNFFSKKLLSVNDIFRVKINGYYIRIKIIKIEEIYNDKTIN